jgi:antitoxin MazE
MAQPGRIVIEAVEREPNLEEMLAAFDPKKHRGEVMAFPPVGREVV